jgi:peptidoglycan/xylan/chitin deacetylase (PgdA/CDA1 family)
MQKKVLAIATGLLLACSTPKPVADVPEARSPSSIDAISMFADPSEVYEVLSRASLEDFKYRVSQMIRYYIIFGAQTEKIVASFDEKIKQGVASSVASEAITSELREMDCQLMEVHSFTHEIEEKLEVIYKTVLERRDANLNDWFIERLAVAQGFDSRAQIFARMNYIRIIKNYHDLSCNDSICRSTDFSPKRLRFSFNPFSDQQALNYKKTYLKEVSIFAANSAPREESCLSRYPAATEAGKNVFGKSMAPGTFAVTYDDGPHPKHTLSILKAWQQSGLAKPTFFWLGKAASQNPQIVKTVSQAGFEIACHSYSHPDLGNIARAKSYDELDRTNVVQFFSKGKPASGTFDGWKKDTLNQQINGAADILEKILNTAPVSPQTKLAKFRLPYGSGFNNAALSEMLKARNLVHIHWMIDSLDWQDKNPMSVFERVKSQMKIQKRGVILFHDIHPQSVEASLHLIEFFKEQSAYNAVGLEKAL